MLSPKVSIAPFIFLSVNTPNIQPDAKSHPRLALKFLCSFKAWLNANSVNGPNFHNR
jgi:hypothetical protein